MSRYLLVDFGSTFSKLTAVDTEKEDIIATASHFTTVETDISIGYHNALEVLKEKLGQSIVFDKIIACSSAAGGLKMAAIGLVEELTVEAARRACFGAGAKVELSFSHHLKKRDVESIINRGIDIILLSGGTDGGNTECVLFNLNMLSQYQIKIPIIFAGNQDCVDEIEEMASKANLNLYLCQNIMPRLNVLNIDDAREQIRGIFLKNIIAAKGIKKIENDIDRVILPTPQAVLKAAELLSTGYMREGGLGEIVVADIGGATTDIYSICSPHAKRSDVVIKGLEELYAKRTVEGDLGMRYSALGVLNALTKEEISLINLDDGVDFEKQLLLRHENPEMLPNDDLSTLIDRRIAEICVDKSVERHAGVLEQVFTPMGMVYNQIGKDLTKVKYIIGTGGVLINSPSPAEILGKARYTDKKPLQLRPENPQFLIDADYILSAMGLLSEIDPLVALKIMKKRLKTV